MADCEPSDSSGSTQAVWENIWREYIQVQELNKQWPNDPEERPYESLYEARDILQTLHSKLTTLSSQSDEARKTYFPALIALELELGKNFVNAEELSASEGHLQVCVLALDGDCLGHTSVSAMLQACNKLGIIWADRGENDKSLTYLLKSKEIYEDYKRQDPPPLCPFAEAHYLRAPPELVGEEEAWKKFESLHTHTLYYLAQVYGNAGEHLKAANNCCVTLDRQIQSKEFDGIDWALNAASLSQFYITRQHFREGRHCLACADRVLKDWEKTVEDELAKKEELKEKLEQARADLSRCWIKYSINALQTAMDERMLTEEPNRQGSPPSVEEITFKFEGLNTEDLEAQAPVDPVKTFDDARSYFLFGQEHVVLAKAYFALDHHASDHVSIVQDLSTLFRLLAFFEDDIPRKCRMHKRRIDMLSDVVNQMNPEFFLAVCRQCHYELGEVNYEMSDLKSITLSDARAQSIQALNKINKFLHASMSSFENFTGSFVSGGKVDVPEDYCHSFVMSKLWIARSHSKLFCTSSEEERRNLERSLAVYKEIVELAAQHPKMSEMCSVELKTSQDMAELLPAKIARL